MPSKRVSLKGKGAELFFGDYEPPNQPVPDAVDATDAPAPDLADSPAPALQAREDVLPEATAEPAPQPRTPAKPSRRRSTPAPAERASNGAAELASTLASPDDEFIAAVRKVVKSPGKEVSFTRLTPEEKSQLADIVYTYKRQGQKTSENEINRIAINSLLLDYKENGQHSILARVLAALLA
jgi:hypothetical protein